MNQNDTNTNKEVYDDDIIIKDCIFCKIIRNEIPSVKIYEDNETLAFLDINPNSRGHILVIPKMHFENIYSLPVETWCHMNIAAQKIAIALKHALSADGINTVMNNESTAGQLIFHAHIHVIPRYNDHEGNKYTYIAGEMEEIAEDLKKVL
jgi:histidine triad (HIT) family protein